MLFKGLTDLIFDWNFIFFNDSADTSLFAILFYFSLLKHEMSLLEPYLKTYDFPTIDLN
jgi:hypothetical protein